MSNVNVKYLTKSFVHKLDKDNIIIVNITLENYIFKQNENIVKVNAINYKIDINPLTKEFMLIESILSNEELFKIFPQYWFYHQDKVNLIDYIVIIPQFLALKGDIINLKFNQILNEILSNNEVLK